MFGSRNILYIGLVVAVGLVAAVRAGSKPSKKKIKKAVNALEEYDYGKPDDPVRAIKKLVRQTHGTPELRTYLEKRLAERLNSDVSLAARQFIARELSIIGTEHTVPDVARLLASEDRHVVEAACYALKTNPSSEVDAALRRHLDPARGTTIVPIVNLLGQRCDSGSVDALAELAKKSKPQVERAAIAALGKIATPKAASVLADIRRKAEGDRKACAARASLRLAQKWAGNGKVKAARKMCRKLSREAYPLYIRRGALVTRIRTGGKGGLEALLAALDLKNEHLKRAAIAQVPRMEGEKVSGALGRTLPDLAPENRVLLIRALADRGGARARDIITRAAREGHPEVRAAAVSSLGKVGTASSVSLLVDALGAGDDTTRQAAGTALRDIQGADASEAILAAMKSAEPAVKVELTGILADRLYDAAVPALLKQAAEGQNVKVRTAAWAALDRLAGLEQFPDMVSAFTGLEAEKNRKRAQKALMAVAGRSDRPSRHASPVISALKKSDSPAVRRSLLMVLTQLPCRSAYEAVEKATTADESRVKDAAVRALTRWKTPRAAPRLLEIAEKGEDETRRILAFRAYIDLVRKSKKSPASLARTLGEAMEVAPSVKAQKRALSALAGVPHPASLRFVADYTGNEGLRKAACTAAVQLGSKLKKKAPDLVARTMKRVVEECGGQLKKKAQAILKDVR